MSQGATEQRALRAGWRPSAAALVAAVVGALTLIRILVLGFSFIDLGGDEAQYWAWSRHLAFGYFTKPPLIAWLIAGTTAVCGNGEACVRVSSPLLHGATAVVIFFLARRLYDARVGVWSASSTRRCRWCGSHRASSQPMFRWSSAGPARCLASSSSRRQAEAREAMPSSSARSPALAIGVGLFAKYAMIYFVLCTAVFMRRCHAMPGARCYRRPARPVALVALAVYRPI